MIAGVGTDIVSVARIGDAFARHGERFVERLLHPLERSECPAGEPVRARFLARRWAAKEAFAKALGTGIRGDVALNAIIVRHDELGCPRLDFSPPVRALLDEKGYDAHLSISDESDYAVAFVVLEHR